MIANATHLLRHITRVGGCGCEGGPSVPLAAFVGACAPAVVTAAASPPPSPSGDVFAFFFFAIAAASELGLVYVFP